MVVVTVVVELEVEAVVVGAAAAVILHKGDSAIGVLALQYRF